MQTSKETHSSRNARKLLTNYEEKGRNGATTTKPMLEELHTQTNEETPPKIDYVWEEGTPKEVNEYISYPYHAYFENIELEDVRFLSFKLALWS